MSRMNTPNTAFRVAIHNQIYFSKYYHISRYEKNPNGKFVYASSWGCQQLLDNLKYLKKVKIFSLFSSKI